MSANDKDEDMISGLTADQRELLQSGLLCLPETMPPRAVWERIKEQGEAEGLLKKPAATRSWYLPSGLAAAAVTAAILLAWSPEQPPVQQAVTVPDSLPTNAQEVDALQALMVESRQLESDLRAIPAEPRVMRAGTAATIAEIEDRIAAIDYQLSDPEVSLSPEEEKIFWRERVRLMKSLVGLRYAQAQRNAL
ncbi:MAG: hypothetical protein QNJ19_11685 [Woeseiaceae bacterium]|nr:hypothetical protein [Woeseiaceae bacterium]